MASSNKTEYLRLSQWAATDCPKHEDFTADNRIIDEKIKEHFTNSRLHLTAEEKEKIGTLAESRLVAGTGEESVIYSFSFSPSVVFVGRVDKPLSQYNAGGYTVVNGGFAAGGNVGATTGIQLSDRNLMLCQSTSAQNGVFYNLNEQYGQYLIVAFK